jgi:subtilisin-like proprotein convertase family protein
VVIRCGDCPRPLVNAGDLHSLVSFPAGVCGGRVQDADIALQIQHPHRADIAVALTGPEVPSTSLWSDLGGDGQDFGSPAGPLVLDDDAARSLEQGPCSLPRSSCEGRFRTPGRTLDRPFPGSRPEGHWVLAVTDGVRPATGTLADWQLAVRCPAVPSAAPTSSSTMAATTTAPPVASPTATMVQPMTSAPTVTASATIGPPGSATPLPATATATAAGTRRPVAGRALLPYLANGHVLVPPPVTATPSPVPTCLEQEGEPNDFYVQAAAHLPLCPDVSLSGSLPENDPEDLFRLEVPRSSTVVAELDLSELPAGSNADLYLYRRGDASSLASSRRPGTLPEELRVFVAAGTYYLRVLPVAAAQRSGRPYRLRWRMAP